MRESDPPGYRRVLADSGAHYSIFKIDGEHAMTALREMFPDGAANEMNFVLFSTSGVHGSYATIEDAMKDEPDDDGKWRVTFLIVQPRLVCMRYGNVRFGAEDVLFLKSLRATSRRVASKIGGA